MRPNKALWLLPSLIAAGLVGGVVWAANTNVWSDPIASPPGSNQFTPINIGPDSQEKNGNLWLSSSDPTKSGELWFRKTGTATSPFFFVKLMANPNTLNGGYTLTLPEAAGNADDILQTDGTGALKWVDPSTIAGIDPDWAYSDPNFPAKSTEIYSQLFTRIGAGDGAVSLKLRDAATHGAGNLYVQKFLQVSGGIIASAYDGSGVSPLLITSPTDEEKSIFEVDQAGVLVSGAVPWARLQSIPTAVATCTANQVVKTVTMTAAGPKVTCVDASVRLDDVMNGNKNETIYHNGAKWVADSFLSNSGTQLGVNLGGETPSFMLDVKGPVGPHLNNTYDLGAAGLAWKNIYANYIHGRIADVGNNQVLYDNGTATTGNAEFTYLEGKLGLGAVSTAAAKLEINTAGTGEEAIRIKSSANASPLNITDSAGTNSIFRVDQSGTLVDGAVPWDKLVSIPATVATCTANQVVKTVKYGPNGPEVTCVNATVSLDDILNGSKNETLYHNGTKWVSDSFLSNSGAELGVNLGADKANFTLDVNGSVGPHKDAAYDLGALANRWKNIYAQNIYGHFGNIGANQVMYDNGTTAVGDADFSYNGSKLGLGTVSTANAKLEINASGLDAEALRVRSSASQSPINVLGSTGAASIFRIDQTGTMLAGDVPWARLSAFPTAPAACTGNQVVKTVGIGADGPIITCVDATVTLENILSGSASQTIRHDGTKWVADSFLTNTGTALGINLNGAKPFFDVDINANVGPHIDNTYDLGSATGVWKNIYAGNLIAKNKLQIGGDAMINGNLVIGSVTVPNFKLEVNGNVGPHDAHAYDLGSAALPWKTIFADNLQLSGALKLGLTPGSVVFMNASSTAAENNANFFWDDANKRLGLGTNNPTAALTVIGDTTIMPAANADGFSGVLMLNMIRLASYGPTNIENELFQSDFSDSGNKQTNLFVGDGSGKDNTAANSALMVDNTGLGYMTLSSIIDGGTLNPSVDRVPRYNTALGARVLQNNQLGSYNTAVGAAALAKGSDGENNSVLGFGAGYNLSGIHNTIIGSETFRENADSGSNYNTVLGSSAMQLVNAKAIGNVAIGFQSNYNNSDLMQYNTSIGYATMHNGGGQYNVALGAYAYSSGVGSYNLAIGTWSMSGNRGDDNVAVGTQAMSQSTIGSGNLALGNGALNRNSGNNSVGIGYAAGYNVITGGDNVFIGYFTGRNLPGGSSNVFIGDMAGLGIKTDTSNTLIVDSGNSASDFHTALLAGKFGLAGYLRANNAIVAAPYGSTQTNDAFPFTSGEIYSNGYHGYNAASTRYYRGINASSCAAEYGTGSHKKSFFIDGVLICQVTGNPNLVCPYTLEQCCNNQTGGCQY